MRLEVDRTIFERFPGVRIGVVVASGVDNTGTHPELAHLLGEAQRRVPRELAGSAVAQLPHVAPWREAYRTFGAKAKQHPSSLENLLRRTLKGEPLRSVNPLVDLYNVVSLSHLVPVGREDVNALQGNLRLRFAGDAEPAVTLLGEREPRAPKPGEVIYADAVGAVCRRWNWKEAERTKLTAATTHAVLVVEALPPVGAQQLEDALRHLAELTRRFCRAQTVLHSLDEAQPAAALSPLP